MSESNLQELVNKITKITDNTFSLPVNKIKTRNNYFLVKIQTSEYFKRYTLDKLQRLYNTYKNNEHQKNVIINNIKNLFLNNWDGAYSELTAYDALNIAFDEPCQIQLNNIEIENTLAKYCSNSRASEIDGYIKDIFTFFEVKTLSTNFSNIFNKLKAELESRNKSSYFIIQSNYPMCLELDGNQKYAALKSEIQKAKKNKEKFLSSTVIKGLNLRFFYEKQPVIIETHVCEDSFAQAQRLERLPLENYRQFVDGQFIKIFVCSGLNGRNSVICSRDFFRALARRVFCRLTTVNEIFDQNSQLTTSFIAKHLSGLLFIVDLSTNIETDIEPFSKLYKIYFYKNPNTDFKHSLININHIYSYLNRLKCEDCDDFRFDNY